jgi:Spy/CpxP family protein refolding chaperone
MRDLSREERREKFEELRTEMESRRGEMEERINSVLLPHQQKRLNQLTMQSKARRQGGTISFAASDTLAEKLNLTEEQKAKLKEAADSAKKELEKKINKLKEKAKEQRQQYAELMGDAFKFEERSGWGNRDRSADRRSGESDKESKNN